MFFPAWLGISTPLGMMRTSLSFPFLRNSVIHSVEITSPDPRTLLPLCSPSPPSFLSISSALWSNTLFPPSLCAHFPSSSLLSTQIPVPKPYHGHSHMGASLPRTLLTFLLFHGHILILRLGGGRGVRWRFDPAALGMEGSGHVIPVLGLLGGPVVGHMVHADGPSLDLQGRAVTGSSRLPWLLPT